MYEPGSGRLIPTLAAALALASVVIAAHALIRPTLRKTRPLTALTAALISLPVAAVHWANSAGGPGTGNGLAGAVAAVVLATIGTLTATVALTRRPRT
jgi:hypothetical protein